MKKGNWTSEEDLLILKLYSRFKSWKKILPAFKNRSDNSIKNRYFNQLRKIAIRKKIYNNAEDIAKMGIETLSQFLYEAVEEAEKLYFNKNKNMTKEKFKEFYKEIEKGISDNEKKKIIDIKSLRESFSKSEEDNKYDNKKEKEEEFKKTEKKHKEKLKKTETLNSKVYPHSSREKFDNKKLPEKKEILLNKNYNKDSLNSINNNSIGVPLNQTEKFESEFYKESSIFSNPFDSYNDLGRNKESSSNTSWKLESTGFDNYIQFKSINDFPYRF